MGTRVLVGAGVVALGLGIGVASAAPKGKLPDKLPPMKPVAIDPAVAKQIKPRALSKSESIELQKKVGVESVPPSFKNIKRLDPVQRALILGQADPAALPGPIVFNARTNYHDDSTYMELQAYNGGSVGVRPLRNYIHFIGTEEVMASPYLRPSLLIHFKAQANTRYLLECAVDGGAVTTFFAADSRGEYSVTSDDKATLLYMRDQLGATEDVVVQVSGNKPGWYMDGCELTASPR